jgi:hypothetical protein
MDGPHLGVVLPNYGDGFDAGRLAAAAVAAEEAGLDSGWMTDHVMAPSRHARIYGTVAEALVTVGWLASRTTRLRLGTSALIVPQREPLLTLKQLVTGLAGPGAEPARGPGAVGGRHLAAHAAPGGQDRGVAPGGAAAAGAAVDGGRLPGRGHHPVRAAVTDSSGKRAPCLDGLTPATVSAAGREHLRCPVVGTRADHPISVVDRP